MSQTPNAVVNESTVVAAVVSPIVVLLLILALLITIGAILMVKRRKPKAKHLTRIEGDGCQRKGKKINGYIFLKISIFYHPWAPKYMCQLFQYVIALCNCSRD